MRWWRRIGREHRVQNALCWIGAQYIRFVHATGRWEVVGAHWPQQFWDAEKPFILAFWHGRLLMMPYSWRRQAPIDMLISGHADGQLIALTVRHFGIGWIAGSSTKGGSSALRAMLRALTSGKSVGITPDGPKGPRMRAGLGAISLARISGAPIVPAVYSAARRKILGTWDRFVMALPFSRGVFVWGAPLYVPKDADDATMEKLRRDLEGQMNALATVADRLVGHDPVPPAEWASASRPTSS